MSIDRLDWHSGGEFPSELPPEAGGTHIGMYITWILTNDFHGEIHRESESDEIMVKKVLSRDITGQEFFITACDEKFWNDDLNEEGYAFTQFYYENDNTAGYYEDYSNTLAGVLETIYHVENSWDNYDKIAPVITQRFEAWKRARTKKWWEFWK
jgi:hypothetical protein